MATEQRGQATPCLLHQRAFRGRPILRGPIALAIWRWTVATDAECGNFFGSSSGLHCPQLLSVKRIWAGSIKNWLEVLLDAANCFKDFAKGAVCVDVCQVVGFNCLAMT